MHLPNEFFSDCVVNNNAELSEVINSPNQEISPIISTNIENPCVVQCNIIGESSALKQALHCITVHGQFDVPVLITGETGTGKELAARGLHYGGVRASKSFIAVNCATLNTDLFSSELFGHKKGAFTDARQDKKGLIAAAENGTLFLDEIDSLSISSQAALLRFLQESEYRPVGSERTYKSNVRIIASANCNLEELIDKGLFRRDLYYRLYILSVHMPALRERKGDIPILIEHFFRQFVNQYGLGEKRVSVQLLDVLSLLPWKGNVRELENLIHRLYLTSVHPVIEIDALKNNPEYVHYMELYSQTSEGSSVVIESVEVNDTGDFSFDVAISDGKDNFSDAKRNAIEKFESQYVDKMLRHTSGNITRAAMLCGKDRRAFGKLVKKYNNKSCEADDCQQILF